MLPDSSKLVSDKTRTVHYARTSTLDQNLDLQLDALKNCGCEKIYQ